MSGAILIVDDNNDNRKLLAFILSRRGYEVQAAADAESALALLVTFRPQLILMDVELPGMSGLELTTQLKAEAGTRDIVVVAVTACAMSSDQDRALAAGCDGYLAKPIDTRALPGIVAEYLTRAPPPLP